MRYAFRPVGHADIPLLRAWRAQPHWVEWWGAPDAFPEDVLGSADTRAWIVELDGAPLAYAQDYDPHAFAHHPFAHLPPGSRGIDQSIGPAGMMNRGHGAAFVAQHCERLFAEGAPVVGTDPHPDNTRAIRAYRKAGFVLTGEPRDTPWGRAVLMEKPRSPA